MYKKLYLCIGRMYVQLQSLVLSEHVCMCLFYCSHVRRVLRKLYNKYDFVKNNMYHL